ncbi:F0F1 ATP synthase subunit A [Tersicoccus sp. Bi-70]|uniref:F0F1 ATP synthase subunit A n=1 Tax=Tersicoccus sp. Bi-70 TaxID=1897634 RepID=UPI000977161E|nr:F0F1 ATP synthase subunit A [Tersicoccus sp. Bi-70]OMH36637.1 ATP synthase F0 subunit A [Tersicoccus sp. Bi-70]
MIALALPAETGSDGGFVAPRPEDLHLPDLIPWGAAYGTGFGKQMLVVLLSAAIVAVFFLIASRRGKLVPGRLQFIGESAYGLVRNSIGKDIIGEKEFRPWVPLLTALFFFILVNNLMGSIPLFQLPSFSHVGSAYAMAGLVYLTWIILGLKRHGGGFFKLMLVPAGVPKVLLIVVVPLEIISNFFVRPLTHSMRLFATMLAGHMIIAICAAGTSFLFVHGDGLIKGLGALTLVGGVAMFLFEVFIQVLQAYVFTLLTAVYIQGSLVEEH